jgi:small subunit ribosomal protein S21
MADHIHGAVCDPLAITTATTAHSPVLAIHDGAAHGAFILNPPDGQLRDVGSYLCHVMATPPFKSCRPQGTPTLVLTRSEIGRCWSAFDSVNSLDVNTEGIFFAGIRSRRQRRSKLCGGSERKCTAEGVFREMKRRKFYEKPSERANREPGEAIRRHKVARKRAQPEGLIAAPRGGRVRSSKPTGRDPFSVMSGVLPRPQWESASAVMGPCMKRCVSSVFTSCRAGAKVESLPR